MVSLLALLAPDIREPAVQLVWLVAFDDGFSLVPGTVDEEGYIGRVVGQGWVVSASVGVTSVEADCQVLSTL